MPIGPCDRMISIEPGTHLVNPCKELVARSSGVEVRGFPFVPVQLPCTRVEAKAADRNNGGLR